MPFRNLPLLPLEGTASEIAGLTFKIWKQRFFYIWPLLEERGLIDDWRQEAASLALAAVKEGYRPGERELLKFLDRGWYSFLRQYGFFKPKGQGFIARHILLGGYDENFLSKAKEAFERKNKQ